MANNNMYMEKTSDESSDSEVCCSESNDDEIEKTIELLKNKGKKRKRGRRSVWGDQVVDDLVDIICSNEVYVQKLVYENTKKSSNTTLYENVLKELNTRCLERDLNILFTAHQTRNKFKSCISWCKKAAMTVRTATGITKFRDDKRLGTWFNQLYPLVKSRESCQPEQGLEPSNENEEEIENVLDDVNKTKTFVPKKTKKAEKNDALTQAVQCFNKMAEKDDTKEILDYMREENDKNRQTQLELYKMECNNFMQMMQMMVYQQQPINHPTLPRPAMFSSPCQSTPINHSPAQSSSSSQSPVSPYFMRHSPTPGCSNEPEDFRVFYKNTHQ